MAGPSTGQQMRNGRFLHLIHLQTLNNWIPLNIVLVAGYASQSGGQMTKGNGI